MIIRPSGFFRGFATLDEISKPLFVVVSFVIILTKDCNIQIYTWYTLSLPYSMYLFISRILTNYISSTCICSINCLLPALSHSNAGGAIGEVFCGCGGNGDGRIQLLHSVAALGTWWWFDVNVAATDVITIMGRCVIFVETKKYYDLNQLSSHYYRYFRRIDLT